MESSVVRQSVQTFFERTAFSGGEAHSFAPWYLNQKFNVSEAQALQQSSDGSYDFGIDAFHIAESTPLTLSLIQAKYTTSRSMIAKGFREFERALPDLVRMLEGIEREERNQN